MTDGVSADVGSVDGMAVRPEPVLKHVNMIDV